MIIWCRFILPGFAEADNYYYIERDLLIKAIKPMLMPIATPKIRLKLEDCY